MGRRHDGGRRGPLANPDGHVTDVSVLRALHEDERGVPRVLDHHLVCYLTGSWGHRDRERGGKSLPSGSVYITSNSSSMSCVPAPGEGACGEAPGGRRLPTCANHGDGRLDVDPLVGVDARVDKDKPVEVGLLHATQCVLDGVVVL